MVIFDFPVEVAEGKGRVDEVVDAVADSGAFPAAVPVVLFLHVVDLQENIFFKFCLNVKLKKIATN